MASFPRFSKKALIAFFCASITQAEVLSLPDYLSQVSHSNPGYQGMIQESIASQATAEQSTLLFKPRFFTKLQYLDDTRDTHAPSIEGTSNIGRSASIGFQEQTPYGLGVQLSYDVNNSNLFNTDSTYVLRPNITNSYVVPIFNFSLWQNFLGREDKANERVMHAQDLAKSYGKAFQARAELVKAETEYWKLAVARKVVRVQQASFDRARAILDFDSKKAKKALVDSSDLLLSQAAVKGKELELHSMLDEEKSAESSFNSARGQSSDEVPEELELPDLNTLKNLPLIQRVGHRGDVKAAEQEAVATSSGSEMARQKLLPELSLYGSIFAWGLNFSMPIDFSTVSSVRNGYAQKANAADLVFQKKVMDEENEWNSLVHKFQEAKERLSIAAELEEIQRKKFETVRTRRARGLTIEDQVFSYELDYLNSSLARAQMEGLILGLHTQMKLFEDETVIK